MGGNQLLHAGLTRILNSVIEVEHVPRSLKSGINKGGGKDLLDLNGITLNSVILKGTRLPDS